MKSRLSKFSVVDFLIVMAILMILVGMFAPHFSESRAKANPVTSIHPAGQAQTAR